MKFNKKEKRIFIILAIILLLGTYYNYIFTPKMNEIARLTTEINGLTDTYRVNEKYKKQVQQKYMEREKINEDFKKLRSLYPPEFNQDELLLTLKGLADDSGIRIESLTFGEPALIKTKEDSGTKGDKKNTANSKEDSKSESGSNEEEKVNIVDTELKKMMKGLGLDVVNNVKDKNQKIFIPNGTAFAQEVSMTIKDQYIKIKKFIESIELLKNKTSIKIVNMAGGASGSNQMITISLSIDFFGIMDRNIQKKGSISNTRKDEDIFRAYDGAAKVNATSSNKEDINSIDLTIQDITARVLPYGENQSPQTVSMTLKNALRPDGNTQKASIFGDNPSIEKVEVFIEEKDGKYFCKFKTQFEAYPDEKYTNLAEFKPAGNEINFLIDSTVRKSKQDESGVEFNVMNKSSKKMKIVIINDDAQKPRVKVIKGTENIETVVRK